MNFEERLRSKLTGTRRSNAFIGGKFKKGEKIPRWELNDWMVVVSKYGINGAKKIKDSNQLEESAFMIREQWLTETELDLVEAGDVRELENELMDAGESTETIADILEQFDLDIEDIEIPVGGASETKCKRALTQWQRAMQIGHGIAGARRIYNKITKTIDMDLARELGFVN